MIHIVQTKLILAYKLQSAEERLSSKSGKINKKFVRILIRPNQAVIFFNINYLFLIRKRIFFIITCIISIRKNFDTSNCVQFASAQGASRIQLFFVVYNSSHKKVILSNMITLKKCSFQRFLVSNKSKKWQDLGVQIYLVLFRKFFVVIQF